MGFVFLIHRSSVKSISYTYGHLGWFMEHGKCFIIFQIFGIIEVSNIRGNIVMDVKKKKPIFKRWWFIILVVIFLISLLGSLGKDDVEPTINEAASTDKKVEEPQAEPVEEATEVVEDVPREYKAALKKAELYAETMSMSNSGIYDQLTSEHGEQFTAEEAQYAIDNLN